MNSRLEQFVTDHREEFDAEGPDPKVWEKILQDVDPGKKKQPPLVRMDWRRWSAVAAAVVLIAGGAWLFRSSTGRVNPDVAQSNSVSGRHEDSTPATPNQVAQTPSPAKDSSQTSKEEPTLASIRPKETEKKPDEDNSVNEEMYHYARLVEIKHNQLKAIEKDEPLLYRQFASDVNKLDSVYHNLQSQLPKNPNREQLLEAMLQNLQLQMQLLNHQLDIIKQINHSKKTEYEKAYKTT
ncbi:MAG TPA: hypothetical protein VHE34_01920 [Puia sp.]|uniref:hypothetical protein n=1 Tax=Puia sp. TaxID=2045100 RepID=UPI002D12D83A|nr:hypothetical protein [Puia sp.]HVU93942.1 hypothetical protein [Puia sp.]